MNNRFRRSTGILAVVAGIFALLSLVVGLAGVNYDFEAFSDPTFLVAIGTSAAVFIRWSYWLNMLGNYLLLIPLALFLYNQLKSINPPFMHLFTISGVLYMVLGATGSAIFAATWPFLIELYESATAAEQQSILLNFQTVNMIAGEGLHGVLQNWVGAVWFLGIGYVLRTKRNILGLFAMSIGGFLILNTVGNIFNIEALSLLGLTANILLGPVWSICIGIVLLRLKAE